VNEEIDVNEATPRISCISAPEPERDNSKGRARSTSIRDCDAAPDAHRCPPSSVSYVLRGTERRYVPW
jgi:hypothetical protein